jgi:LuxR family maltose regulon positive regulatory protein
MDGMLYNNMGEQTMEIAILGNKLKIPPLRANLLLRSQLINQLNQGLDCRLSLVSALAGYGKCSLLKEWFHQLEVPALWLSLDQEESRPALFWAYFVAALQGIPAQYFFQDQ